MDLGKLVKAALPVAAGAFLGPAAGAMFPGATGIMASPFMRSALVSGATGLLTGQKPKDAILSGIMGGLGGQMFGTGNQAAMQQGLGGAKLPIGPSGRVSVDQMAKKAVQDTVRGGAGTGAANIVSPVAADTMSAKLLEGIGVGSDNLLFKLLNTKLGEGVAAGLIAQLLSGDEEEGPVQGSYEQRKFGEGGPGGKLGGMNYADGGEAYFPRRNGGIDPSEGSGTKDDVPALLLAGEFVHTRESNEGLGKMMGAKTKDEAARKGIQAQYELMNAFERMA